MKVLIIDCTTEELRANRTIMECVKDALRSFTDKLGVSDVSGLSGKLFVDEPDEEEMNDDEL